MHAQHIRHKCQLDIGGNASKGFVIMLRAWYLDDKRYIAKWVDNYPHLGRSYYGLQDILKTCNKWGQEHGLRGKMPRNVGSY